ncbi:MAG: zinc-binding alcohol dehydrogenase family protein [Cyanobacteria bacterium J06638_38]
MKAIGLYQYLPAEDENSLQDVDLTQPVPKDRDLLVEVNAISVNPVDTKIRSPKEKIEEEPRILGWDAAGTVVAVGDRVEQFKPGDDVYYAGDITRPGTNSEFHLVDERIVGHKPKTLSKSEAAALPLTSITAWEALFDRLNISKTGKDAGKSILIIGGAGGVGSIAIQMAKKVAKLNVIATASRPETIDWCKQQGADIIVNHRHNLAEEIEKAGYKYVDYILCLNSIDAHWQAIAQAIKPQGMICSIVENQHPLEMNTLKSKSAGLVWEFMFTRSMYQTDDMNQQHQLLNEISNLMDIQVLHTTCNDVVRPINAQNLRSVHARIEKGSTIGKIVLADWG